jgi:diguanylate cyclase (GGDEF)-like protein
MTDPGPADLIWAGAWTPPELDRLEARCGVRIARFGSALRAISALSQVGARVALLAGEEVDGRERAAIEALRDAGVRSIAILYRPDLAHRARLAKLEGADAVLQLPAHPGDIELLVESLLGRPVPVLAGAPPEVRGAAGWTTDFAASESKKSEAGPEIVGRTTLPTTPEGLAIADDEPTSSDDRAPSALSAQRDDNAPALPGARPPATEPPEARPEKAGRRVAAPDALDPVEIRRAPVTEPVGPPDRRTLETLVGDAALVHRMVGDLDRLLDRVLESCRARSTATRCSLMLLDRTRGELLMQRAIGLPDRDAWTPIPLGEGIAGRVARNGIPLLAADISEVGDEFDSWEGTLPTRQGYNTRSCLVLPLCGGEGVAGVVCLADKESGEPFIDADLRSLLFLSDQSGQALENAVKLRQMRDLAVIDELTGLYNRRYFQRALAREVQRARRYDRPLTVAIMDLDHFKKFNDTCGHPAGDRALAAVGDILRTSLREVDIVARHGGEEFAVILPETSPAATNGTTEPFPFLERLRQRIQDTRFEGQEKLPSGNLTVSIGVACFPADADTAEDLFQKADDALYASKDHGRNVVTYRGHPVAD